MADFAVHPWRFSFVAREPIRFPRNRLGNGLRGGFGASLREVGCSCSSSAHSFECEYARFFSPTAPERDGPSGLADRPRPFTLRGTHLDGRSFEPGERFGFDIHVFLRDRPPLPLVVSALQELARTGFGPGRGRAELVEAPSAAEPLFLPLDLPVETVDRIWLRFVTATELKWNGTIVDRPDFHVLFSRARDRVATISALYGTGPLPLDFKALGEHSELIRLSRCDLRHVDVRRTSANSGQRHKLGGFVGEAEYAGDLGRFVPILRAAEWTGVGRQTVWGKGVIRCSYP